jgi:hypothetical protein
VKGIIFKANVTTLRQQGLNFDGTYDVGCCTLLKPSIVWGGSEAPLPSSTERMLHLDDVTLLQNIKNKQEKLNREHREAS